MSFKKPKYFLVLSKLKDKPGFSINVKRYGRKNIRLRVLSSRDLPKDKTIDKLSAWRRKHAYWFGAKFKITRDRTRKWLKTLVLEKEDRILFVIEDQGGNLYGHLGFNRYRAKDNSCELDNVIRGEGGMAGLMTDCVDAIVSWGFKNLGIKQMYLTTFFDNQKAVNLYLRCNFKIIRKIPLFLTVHDGQEQWEPIKKVIKGKVQRYYARMRYKKP